jgi:phosphatidylinositol glycan class O
MRPNPPPYYKKVVCMLIDALREDFVEMPDQLRGLEVAHPENYKLQAFNDKLKKEPENTTILKIRSDAPTLTWQRIKAISTGTIPTFLEMGENIGAG